MCKYVYVYIYITSNSNLAVPNIQDGGAHWQNNNKRQLIFAAVNLCIRQPGSVHLTL